MRKILVLLLLPCLSLAWGRLGHEITAKIAEIHLSNDAKAGIKAIMGNTDLVSISNWLDEIRPSKRFLSLHYASMTPEKVLMHDKYSGQLHKGITDAIKTIKQKQTPKAKKQEAMKILVHLVGDAHQPLHVGNGKDMGGNLCYVFWFKRKQPVSLHKIWDTFMVRALYKQKPWIVAESTEITPKHKQELQKTAAIIWLQESRAMHSDIYPIKCSSGIHFKQEYVSKHLEQVKQRLTNGGIRLAGVLNEIFKPENAALPQINQ